MDITSDVAKREEAAGTPFGAILKETITEMESAEAADLIFEDVIQRLSLAAQHVVTVQAGGPLPRVGGYAYQTSTVTPPAITKSQLDVRF
ncbi:MAG: hypothetical protein ABI852_04760 [Gemmatimonadaceae bacterium]